MAVLLHASDPAAMRGRAKSVRRLGRHVVPLLTSVIAAPVQANSIDAVGEEILVIASGPASGLPIDRLPANVQTVGGSTIEGGSTVADALNRTLGSVSMVDSLGNALQTGLTLRGFTAAPALGEPQGVVVYQGAMRANEAFGDVVQWDLLPSFAIAQAQVIPGSNPLYGLNGIGGAVALTMKDGFAAPGGRAELLAGSFGRKAGTAEYGAAGDAVGFYAGVDAVDDDGWRDVSPSRLVRGFADVAWQSGDSEVGLSLNAADSRLAGNGPAPADLLAERRRAVFTYPDITDSTLVAGTLRATLRPTDQWEVDGGAYLRRLRRSTVNGDRAEFEACGASGSLCFGEDDPELVVDAAGRPISLDDEADAVFNRTRTRTLGWGANAQATLTAEPRGRDNILIFGATIDGARTRYASGTELGELQADRGVESLGIAIGNDEFNVGLRTRSTFVSLYASNTLSLTPRLHVSGSLRWNRATLRLRDQIGTALDGDHRFSRLNLGAGVTWNLGDVTAYAAVAQNNRVPTPAELSCADPERPCRFPNAFLADPPLDDVRARTFEVGLRGAIGSAARFALAAFDTRNRDDIVFISAGEIVGTGYFDNVGATRRRGIEASLEGEAGRLTWRAAYALTDATFRTPLTIRAPDNPEADDEGEIDVERGDRLPGIPRHSLKLGAGLAVTDKLTGGIELIAASGRYLRGDEANLTAKLGGHVVANLDARYRLGDVELFARVENLFDRDYATFGIYGEADELGFEDPRFLSPAAPRSVRAGLRATF